MTPAPKRRWLRFSLRTLFAVVTALALVLPLVATGYRKWLAMSPGEPWPCFVSEAEFEQMILASEGPAAN